MKQKLMRITSLLFTFLLFQNVQAQQFTITGPAGSEKFGDRVTVLTNGNYVITDPFYDEGATINVGAVYLYNGSNHTLISVLKGSTANDQLGSGLTGITALSNGNFLVSSPNWDNGTAIDAGAVTWVNGSTGISGVVSSSNSLVGSTAGDNLGSGYLIITVLSNGNYVVSSPNWDNGAATDAGAVTWGNGSTGISGVVSSSNSLVGSTTGDKVGSKGIQPLSNGNYVVGSSGWDNGAAADAGAATWGNGNIGISGVVSSSNSLVGFTAGAWVGSFITPLSNGNYVVSSPGWKDWNSNMLNSGAVTWGNGSTGTTGIVSTSNSLVGCVAEYIVALSNGNYVVTSPNWRPLPLPPDWTSNMLGVGAVTWGNGSTGTTGVVSSSNSLVGSTAGDQVGLGYNFSNGIIPLSNGNYVVASPRWANGNATAAGAVTWGNGSTGTAGIVSSSNSLVGSTAGDQVGYGPSGVTALSNGNYVVSSADWDNGAVTNAGAATWVNGRTGKTGVVSSSNSLVGSTAWDQVGHLIKALSNGNYVVNSPFWDNGAFANVGAATWVNGSTGATGIVSSSNSLVGFTAGDAVGDFGITVLSNGNYVVNSPYWDNGAATDAGAVTWGNGSTGTTGIVSSSNSLVGSNNMNQVGWGAITALSNGNYVVFSRYWNNGAATDAGAVTWGNGSSGTTGVVSSSNSLVGSTANDGVGWFIDSLSNGYYVVYSRYWDNGAATDAGAATLGNGSTSLSGTINSCNSVTGSLTNGYVGGMQSFNAKYQYLVVGLELENKVVIFNPVGQALSNHFDVVTTGIHGNTAIPFIANPDCRIIATLTANGASPVSGSTTAKVWIEATQPNEYVKRHYEITPATNAITATGRVTLYFTQAEFDDFNAINTFDLPTGATDANGISNLRIEKRGGTSSDGSGLPATYSGSTSTIDPDDTDIIWNATLSRWEVSVDVTGFSGFFAKSTPNSLPVSWLLVTGNINNNKQPQLSWKVSENNVADYEAQKSMDGRNFFGIGTINSKGDGTNTYSHTEPKALNGAAYYRIKQTDLDGRFSYSAIIKLYGEESQWVTAYPNPFTNSIRLYTNKTQSAIVTDVTGKTIVQLQLRIGVTHINPNTWSSGLYLLKTSTGQTIKLIKE